MKLLVGGVGFGNLRDMSVGPAVVDLLRRRSLPKHVEVADLNNLIDAYHRLKHEHFDRLILVSAVKRGRAPGSVTAYAPDVKLPPESEISARIGEAYTGIISLDSLLIVCKYYLALPEEVLVVEVEPADEDWGEGFSSAVAAALEQVVERVVREIDGR